MLKYLLVVLSESSTSFCHYESKPGKGPAKDLIPLKSLENAVIFALKNNLKVNFLYPARKLGQAYEDLIEGVDHVKIVPFAARARYPEAILVIESSDFPVAVELRTLRGGNIILRLRRTDLPKLSACLGRLLPRAKRVNLVLTDVEKYGPGEFTEYRRQLEKVSTRLQAMSAGKEPPELNVLTDRLVLGKMNNCDAGLSHLTVAPNGRFYLCPAFFYGSPDETLGEIRNDVPIGNRQLLELKYAPICRICDAYHCRRCVFLNRTLTLELNTPSYQQCQLSHIEREASRLYSQKLKAAGGSAAALVDIPEIAYDDPFDVVVANKQSIAEFKKL
jgi:CXXX repeat peptide maturase